MNRTLPFLTCLLASTALAASLTRGPVQQLASSTEITIVFRTDVAALGRVRFGLSPTSLTQSVTDVMSTQTHVLKLSGLTPSTRYWYAVDLDGVVAASGDGLRFRTYPVTGSVEAFRLFAWGDSGNASAGQFQVANQMANQIGDAALSLILGDIIYDIGAPQDYDPKYFVPYAPLLKRMVVWPTIGNHDVGLDPMGGPYLDAFYLPTNNSANSELYYSFDYGNAHFVCLDTHVNSYAPGSPQMLWAAQDLAASNATWKFAYFHVPPYSGGTHPDDSSIQAGIVPVLEDAGVDVVFSGHSHSYERTFLLKNGAIVQNDAASYSKTAPRDGTLYVVSGTAGQSGPLGNPAHPLMAVQRGNVLGNSVIDVAGNSVHGYFLLGDGGTVDLFQLNKPADTAPVALLGVRALSATQVVAVFSEPVAVAGTGDGSSIGRYAISMGISVQSAVVGTDQRSVTLTTSPHAGGAYTLTVTGLADRAMPANVSGTLSGSYSWTVADAGVVDAGPADAGVADAGAPDAGIADAGVVDAGVVDAGVADAGVRDEGVSDAGTPDAGVPDAGISDAGAPDAGLLDAGTPDAGAPDAGVPDAGQSSDAGVQLDAGARDAGLRDGGSSDGGTDMTLGGGGCSCAAGADREWVLALVGLMLRRRKKPAR